MDPLEAAKISKKSKEPRDTRPEPQVTERAVSTAPEEPAHPAAATPPAEDKPKSYMVMETRTFAWQGYVTTLSQGGVVSESGYGKVGIQRMLDQGFKLREIETP